MTDQFSIGNCKAIRKVDVGEVLKVVDCEQTDSVTETSRLKFKALRDGQEGWVTLKGNAGSVYIQISDSHYIADETIPLRACPSKHAPVSRMLEKGEAMQSKAPAKEVKPIHMLMARVRPLESREAGWVVFSPGLKAPFKPWKAKYVCKSAVEITSALAFHAGTRSVRTAVAGQILKVVDGPRLDSMSGQHRVCVVSAEDGVAGWASLRDFAGEVLMDVA